MKHLFIPYELALLAKEKGFDESCFGLWTIDNGKYEVQIIGKCNYSKDFRDREVLAPLYQQIIDWFREKHNILIIINDSYNINTKEYKFYPVLYAPNIQDDGRLYFGDCWTKNYYEALNKAIKEAFKLI